jgi:hypothetical protein
VSGFICPLVVTACSAWETITEVGLSSEFTAKAASSGPMTFTPSKFTTARFGW